MFVKLFNANKECVEYVRRDKITKVNLLKNSQCYMITAQLEDQKDANEGYFVKLFCLKEELDDPDMEVPMDFYVFCDDEKQIKQQANEYLTKFMSKF